MNEYVETAKKVITDTANKVAETSNTLYTTAKLSLKISKLNSEIDEYYKKIGETVYCNYNGREVSEEPMETLCQKVDKLKEQVSLISAELAQIKGLDVCENCGAEIKKGSSYCAKCGTEV